HQHPTTTHHRSTTTRKPPATTRHPRYGKMYIPFLKKKKKYFSYEELTLFKKKASKAKGNTHKVKISSFKILF
ncbi:MAG: hypothetical protein GY938_03115, partial [Ketobacter sp.]|nr:hypothetical protein [Ketobacter sp.]